MEKDEQLGALMAGFRGSNLNDADFARSDTSMNFVEVEAASDDALPLVYDPEAIAAYWCGRARGAGRAHNGRCRAGARWVGARAPWVAWHLHSAPAQSAQLSACPAVTHAPCCPHPAPGGRRDVRPVSVVRRIVQLMGIAGSFFSGLLLDFATGKVRRTHTRPRGRGCGVWPQT